MTLSWKWMARAAALLSGFTAGQLAFDLWKRHYGFARVDIWMLAADVCCWIILSYLRDDREEDDAD